MQKEISRISHLPYTHTHAHTRTAQHVKADHSAVICCLYQARLTAHAIFSAELAAFVYVSLHLACEYMYMCMCLLTVLLTPVRQEDSGAHSEVKRFIS